MATFGVNTLQRKRWALVHVVDPYGLSARDALTQQLKQLGVELVVTQGIEQDKDASSNMVRFVQAARDAKADVIASYTTGADSFVNPVVFAKLLRQNAVEAAWIGSPTTTNSETVKRAGADLDGAYAVTDFAAQASPAAEAFAQKYQAAYSIPADQSSACNFDAINVLAKAIASAGATEPDKIRAAILGIRDYQGAEGTYSFDPNGDGLHGYNIVHNENGRWVFNKHVEFGLGE